MIQTELAPTVPAHETSYSDLMGIAETTRMRPMDHLTREITPSSAIDLVAGCALVAGIIEKEGPDIVFFPLRGAGPIEWATREILELDKAPVPAFVDLPLGTHHDLQTRRESKRAGSDTISRSGLTGQEKISVVNTAIGRLAREGSFVPNTTKLMLVDEVQKGRTITQAAEALRRATMNLGDDQTIDVVAVQDVHDSPNGTKKNDGFLKLAGNERSGLRTYVLPVALFTVDQDKYLDAIVKDSPEDLPADGEFYDLFKVARNIEARLLIRSLVRAWHSPEAAALELDMIRQGKIVDDIDQSTLQYAVVDSMTDPRRVVRRTSDDRILNWWSDYIKLAIQHQETNQTTTLHDQSI